MARKIDVKRILEEKLKGTSHNCIASDWGISKHSVKDVCNSLRVPKKIVRISRER